MIMKIKTFNWLITNVATNKETLNLKVVVKVNNLKQ